MCIDFYRFPRMDKTIRFLKRVVKCRRVKQCIWFYEDRLEELVVAFGTDCDQKLTGDGKL